MPGYKISNDEITKSESDVDDGLFGGCGFRGVGGDCGRMEGLFAFAEGDHGGGAGNPSGEIIENGNQFDDKRGKQQDVKTDDPTDEHGGDEVDGLVNAPPAERREQELQAIGRHGDGQGEDHAGGCQSRRGEEIEFGRYWHALVFED